MHGGGQFSSRFEPSKVCLTNPRWVGVGNDLFWELYSMHGNQYKAEVSHLSFRQKEWVPHARIMKVKWSPCLGARQGIPKGVLILRSRVDRSEVEEVLYPPWGWSWDHMVSGEPGCQLFLYWRHWQSYDSLQGHPVNPPGHIFWKRMQCGQIILVIPGQA